MKNMKNQILSKLFFLIFTFSSLFIGFSVFAIEDPKVELSDIGVDDKLGNLIDLSLDFKTTTSQTVSLKDIAKDKPLIIIPAYYSCPRLCSLVLNGVLDLVDSLNLKIANDYNIVTVSINPNETIKAAIDYEEKYNKNLKGKWHFLTGNSNNIDKLMNELGFKYIPDGESDFAHIGAIFVLTSKGKLSQFFKGIAFDKKQVRLALVDSSNDKIGTFIDQIALFCFRFDPLKGKYTWAAWRFMRIGGVLTLLFLLSLMIYLFRSEKRKK